jgi:hypothetical protein
MPAAALEAAADAAADGLGVALPEHAANTNAAVLMRATARPTFLSSKAAPP